MSDSSLFPNLILITSIKGPISTYSHKGVRASTYEFEEGHKHYVQNGAYTSVYSAKTSLTIVRSHVVKLRAVWAGLHKVVNKERKDSLGITNVTSPANATENDNHTFFVLFTIVLKDLSCSLMRKPSLINC